MNPARQPSCHARTGVVLAYRVAFHSDRLPRGGLVSHEVAAEGVAHVVAIRVQIHRARGLLLEPGEQQLLQHKACVARPSRAGARTGCEKADAGSSAIGVAHIAKWAAQKATGMLREVDGTEGHRDATKCGLH